MKERGYLCDLCIDFYVLFNVHRGMILVNNQLADLHTRRSSTQSDINQVSH